MPLLIASLFAFLLGTWSIEVVLAAGPAAPRINCNASHQRSLDLEPVGEGPLALSTVYCQMITGTPFPQSASIVSQDGRSIAYYDHNTILRVAPLDEGSSWTSYTADLGAFARFGAEIRSIPAVAWSSDSQFLWTATHERERPHGFAKTPMQPVRTAGDGTLKRLPPLTHAAGPLDALLWANGDGLAVAQFGTRGGQYKPEHDDPDPTFAIVDARRGLVLDSLPFESIDVLKKAVRRGPAYVHVTNAAATSLSDGRVRTLLSVRKWVVWTQGEAPRVLDDPYVGERHNRMVLSPDGSRVLVGRLLRTKGGKCTYRDGCFPGQPVEGILAALHDLDTGQPVWTLHATVTHDFDFPTPAISMDGRYALIGLVPTANRAQIALVTLKDGKIVQTFPAPGVNYAMGFLGDSQTVWTNANGLTALYALHDNSG